MIVVGGLALGAGAFEPQGLQAQVKDPSKAKGNLETTSRTTVDRATVEKLLKKTDDGPVRVIVQFDIGSIFEAQMAQGVDRDTAQAMALDSTRSQILSRLDGTSVGAVSSMKTAPMMAMDVGADALLELADDPAVVSIQEDYLLEPHLIDSVPLVGASSLHVTGVDGFGRAVAILDTGVDTAHPFFAGRVVAEACFSTTSAAANATSVCPGGVVESVAIGSGRPCPAEVAGCRHGTHVAGIAAGSGDSFTGVAPGADIIALQVFSRFDDVNVCGPLANPCARAFVSDVGRALEHVVTLSDTLPIAAANLSLGSGSFATSCDTDLRKQFIDELRTRGVATVIASGNSGEDGAVGRPACISSAVTVGSTTKFDEVSLFSNHATLVDVMAPGSTITSSLPGGVFDALSGTSMAAPHVAGAFAVLSGAEAGATIDDIERALEISGQPVSRAGITIPRIQVDAALVALQDLDPIGPANDDFVDAVVLAGLSASASGSTVGATEEIGEPIHAGVGGGASVWWQWTPPRGGLARIDTTGSDYDTVLAVYQGTDVSSLVEVASNDDVPGTLLSAVEFRAQRDQTYHVAVDGYFGDTGSVVLNYELEGEGPGDNDAFVNAAALSGPRGQASGSNIGATEEFGEPIHAGVGGGKSVWWSWQAPTSQTMTFNTTGSDYDTVLAVYVGGSVNALQEIAANDDDPANFTLESAVTFGAIAGQTYRIAVDGYFGSEGNIILNFLPTSEVAVAGR